MYGCLFLIHKKPAVNVVYKNKQKKKNWQKYFESTRLEKIARNMMVLIPYR
jgi:hypothetical protein